ncbi:MAG: cysteine rich repeat-containing protein, partial [Pseudolabrys sp.]
MRTFSIVGFLLLTGFLIVPAFDLATAQQPTEAERDAIRSACRSDFVMHCASVQPGGKEALECLLQNDSKL